MSVLRDRLVPTSHNLGARVEGLDLRSLDEAAFNEFKAAVERHGVIFVPGQHLTREEQVDFASRFGALAPSHPWLPPLEGYPSVRPLVTGSPELESPFDHHRAHWRRPRRFSEWHADLTPAINPPAFSILCAEKVPDRGGDTTWASTTAAYAALSAPLRSLVDGLTAEHRYSVGYVPMGASDPRSVRFVKAGLIAQHPVVRVLDSKERALFINPSFTSHILELSPIESAAILDMLYYHMTQIEFTARFSWEEGDLAIWDNRRCIHAAPEDHENRGQTRVMYRVMTVGDVPVGTNGRSSTSDEPRRYELNNWIPR